MAAWTHVGLLRVFFEDGVPRDGQQPVVVAAARGGAQQVQGLPFDERNCRHAGWQSCRS